MNYLHGLSIFRQPNCVDETDTKVTKRVSNLEKVAVIYISVGLYDVIYDAPSQSLITPTSASTTPSISQRYLILSQSFNYTHCASDR